MLLRAFFLFGSVSPGVIKKDEETKGQAGRLEIQKNKCNQ